MLNEELYKLGIDWVMNYYPYNNPVPKHSTEFEKMLIKHIKSGSTIAIFPDSDIDGMFSALEIKSLLELMGCKHIKILKITKKSHGLNNKFIDQVMDLDANLLITVDSTTNNSGAIDKLSLLGVDHIIVDHHEITADINSYADNVIVINSRDNGNEEFSKVSAGMLCYILIHNLLYKIKIDNIRRTTFLDKMYVLGYITLYTDCMDLKDRFNLSVINNIESRRNFTPKIVTQFMSEYDCLCRQFIEFKFAPRINSLIRAEMFDLVYDIMFNRHTDTERAEILQAVEKNYEDSREAIQTLALDCKVEIHDLYVIGNLDGLQLGERFREILKNYTGLIANNLSTRYNKLAVVVSTDKIESYKGSVRDPYSRRALVTFNSICDCGGHMSAFGIHLLKKDFGNFKKQLRMMSSRLATDGEKSQIVLDGSKFDDRLKYYVRSIAEFNEIGGNTMPKAIIRKKIGHSMKVRRDDKYSTVMWEGLKIVCFKSVYVGDIIDVTPTLAKSDVVCYGVPSVASF